MSKLQELQNRIGYTFEKEGLLRQALTHSSFAHLYEQRDENFGNARDVRNVFEKSIARQCDRIVTLEAPTKQQLMELTLSDLTGGEADAGEARQLSGEETKA